MADDAAQNGGTGGNGKPDSPDIADRVKTWAGLALAGFLATVNLIGLNNGEIPNILRNNIVAADVTGLLILAAAMTAVIGALLPAKSFPVLWLVPIALAVAAVALLPEMFIRIPTEGDYTQSFVFWSGALGMVALVALGAMVYRYSPNHAAWVLRLSRVVLIAGTLACGIAVLAQKNSAKNHLSSYLIWLIIFLAATVIASAVLQFRKGLKGGPKINEFSADGRSVLLVLAVVLTAVATVGALRAETRSQAQSTTPKLDSVLTLSGINYSLTVDASAAHLPGDNTVRITVYGLPQPVGIAPRGVTLSGPCQGQIFCQPSDCPAPNCTVIASSFYGPDAQGSLQAKLAVLFGVTSYSIVDIFARRITPGKDPCQKGTESQCFTATSLVIPPS